MLKSQFEFQFHFHILILNRFSWLLIKFALIKMYEYFIFTYTYTILHTPTYVSNLNLRQRILNLVLYTKQKERIKDFVISGNYFYFFVGILSDSRCLFEFCRETRNGRFSRFRKVIEPSEILYADSFETDHPH